MLHVNDAATYDVKRAHVQAISHCREFLRVNNIRDVHITTTGTDDVCVGAEGHIKRAHRYFSSKTSIPGVYYDYADQMLLIIDNMSYPLTMSSTLMRSKKNYMSAVTDGTAFGVIAHETGHHVENMCITSKKMKSRMKHVLRNTKCITPYDKTSSSEAFAETLRMYILNPNLLRVGRLERYEYVAFELGLKPIIKRSWQNVLRNAPRCILDDVRSWIRQG